MTARRRVVITGMGVVSAAGCDLAAFWRALIEGRSAVAPIRRFDASGYPSQIAAEVPLAEMPGLSGGPDPDRIARYASEATARAIADADATRAPAWSRAGVAIAAGMGRYGHQEVFAATAAARAGHPQFDWPAFTARLREGLLPSALARRTPGSIAAGIAARHGLGGPVLAVMTACAGGTQAIGDAVRWIRLGRADMALAGGADSELYPMGLASFCLLGALSTRNDAPTLASRPFDAARDGFVLGEGAATLVLEEREHALRRGAKVYAEVAGFGSAGDAWRVTDPHPEGLGAVLAMSRAIADAGLTPDDIDYINAHGTSTPANDRVETVAITRLFGERAARVPVSSTKSMIGHATVAAGAIESVVAALTLTHQRIHPTINQTSPDPACPLDYVPNVSRAATVSTVLSNSFAFGGQTASLVFRHADG